MPAGYVGEKFVGGGGEEETWTGSRNRGYDVVCRLNQGGDTRGPKRERPSATRGREGSRSEGNGKAEGPFLYNSRIMGEHWQAGESAVATLKFWEPWQDGVLHKLFKIATSNSFPNACCTGRQKLRAFAEKIVAITT